MTSEERNNKESRIRTLENSIFELCFKRIRIIGTPHYTEAIDAEIKDLTAEMMKETKMLMDWTKGFEGLKAKNVIV